LAAGGFDDLSAGGPNAKDYGPKLTDTNHGGYVVPLEGYQPQAGDVVVFESILEHKNGHIEIYDGNKWFSDFDQGQQMYPYRATTPCVVYRFP